jgi:acyl-CoA synthetase (AMP-forming)/AMP-acid ligase II
VATTYFDQTSVRPETAPTTIPANLQLARANIELMEYTAQDVLYTAFPLFHVNARFTAVISAIISGARLVLDDRFSASRFWERMGEEEVTSFNYMGTRLSAEPVVRSSRAVVQTRTETFEVHEFERLKVGLDDAILRLELCGTCGSDIEQCDGRFAAKGWVKGYGLLGPGHDRHATVESELICYRRHANFSWARSDLLEDRRFAVVAPNILQCLD